MVRQFDYSELLKNKIKKIDPILKLKVYKKN